METFQGAKASCPGIVAIRAQGSMVAVEFNDPATGKPSAELTRRYQQAALEQGLLLFNQWSTRQLDSFPVSADHPRCAVQSGAEDFGQRVGEVTRGILYN